MSRFVSEIRVPVQQDVLSNGSNNNSTTTTTTSSSSSSNFMDRQSQQWGDMEARMAERRKEWESEFDRMRQDFFSQPMGSRPPAHASKDLGTGVNSMYETDADGNQKFKVKFDVNEFKPEEIQVKVHENKLMVSARHEEASLGNQVTKEYSRQVDIPATVDQAALACTLSRDGLLSVEAPANITMIAPSQQIQTHTFPTAPKSLDVSTAVRSPIVTEADGSRKLRLEVDIGEFRPEDVEVKTLDRKLIVHASKEERGDGRTMTKEFNKEFDLPESVDPASVQAFLTGERQLTLEAPLKPTPARSQQYKVVRDQDVRNFTVNKESSVSVSQDGRPVVTINVNRK